jgi:hypothetical protein
VQGTRSVDEYFQEMEMCLLHTEIIEDEESTMARFLVGLNKPFADKVDMTKYTNLTELVHFATRAEWQLAESYRTPISFSAHNSSTPWRHSQRRESGLHTPSSHAASRPVSTSANQFNAKGKAVSSNQSNSSAAASSRKISKIDCFKCGGHGHKQAECPNRCAIVALADGSYDSQSESEDEHNILALSNENLQTCEYQDEDGEYERGLNCLAIQSIPHVASDDIPQAIIPPNPKEITSANFDDLLADINYLEAPISSNMVVHLGLLQVTL